MEAALSQSRERVAFESFVALRGQQLLRLAYVMTEDAHLAEDLTQTVLLRMHQLWATIDHPYSYARRALTNLVIDHGRRSDRELPVSAEVLASLESAGLDEEPDSWRADALPALIRSLPSRQRVALVLRYYEHLETAEIAKVMGVRDGSVRSAIARAIADLRASLLDNEGRAHNDRR
ncbi:SigE family RNA polymerase sigma factor [Nocardioides dubius]|uniref:SigE family RNA polymerase sigma factor n=1 Tax=Nocardioides dubius TaxID=317019 RepID=A0ABN1U5F6_9ACTN